MSSNKKTSEDIPPPGLPPVLIGTGPHAFRCVLTAVGPSEFEELAMIFNEHGRTILDDGASDFRLHISDDKRYLQIKEAWRSPPGQVESLRFLESPKTLLPPWCSLRHTTGPARVKSPIVYMIYSRPFKSKHLCSNTPPKPESNHEDGSKRCLPSSSFSMVTSFVKSEEIKPVQANPIITRQIV
jgi:hypothetical protein